jgi:O-antigen/teichoic acid export membrane protein
MTLARGTALRLGAHVAAGLLSLAALPLLVRHLGLADFGRYVAVLSIVGIALLASDLGITAVALRDSALASGDRRRNLLAGLLGARVAIASVGAAAAIVFALAAGYGDAAVAGTAVACLGLFPQAYTDLVVATMVVEERYLAAGAVELTRSAAGTLLVVALVVAGAGLAAFLAAWAGAAIAGALAARAAAGDSVALRPHRPRGDSLAALRGSLAFALATALHVVYFRAVMVITSVSAPAREGGYFAAAFRLTEFLGAGAGQAAGTATPTLARAAGDRDRFRATALRVIGASALLGVVVGGAMAVAAPVVVAILGGDELKPAASVVRIQAIAIALMFAAFAAGGALFALRRHRALAIVNSICLAVAVTVALLLVPDHGADGAAVAAATAEASLLVCELAVLGSALRRE